ncbi:MAG: hypothetical protein ABFR33_07295 [Verrucomicrobiota bacterium]
MKRNGLLKVAVLLLAAGAVSGGETPREHGLVGLRPLPRTEEMSKIEWMDGIGYYEKDCTTNDFIAAHTDVLMDYKGAFRTNLQFFEHYLPTDRKWIDTDHETNPLIQQIVLHEKEGWEVEHILICREARLLGKGDLGPIKEDGRILCQRDVDDYRKVFKAAYEKGLVNKPDYKLIQMVEHTSAFMNTPEARKIVRSMDGICYESHQFNRHWPYETGWTNPDDLARGAKWTLAQGLEYIFYYGPFIYKDSPGYYEFAERDWLYGYWKAGLPKHHPKMHYYLNAFPHAHGDNRPVGPESNPHSYMGMTKWLIEEIKGKQNN